MPLVNVKVIEGVFSDSQKREMVKKLTDAMVSIEGEKRRIVDIEESLRLGLGRPISQLRIRIEDGQLSAAQFGCLMHRPLDESSPKRGAAEATNCVHLGRALDGAEPALVIGGFLLGGFDDGGEFGLVECHKKRPFKK